MSECNLNIYEKLALIGQPIKIIKKSKQGYGYSYVPEEDILARIQSGMDKYKVSLIPKITHDSVSVVPRDTLKTKVGKSVKPDQPPTIYEERVNEVLVLGEITYEWVNNENPDERISVPWFFVGQQNDASQAFGSALTYASRYFKLQYFNCATSNDPDALIAQKKKVEADENKEILSELYSQIGSCITEILDKDSDKRDDVISICKKYAFVGNKPTHDYRKITDPKTAVELLNELNTFSSKIIKKAEDKK